MTATTAARATEPAGRPIVIRSRMVIAAEDGAEPFATGEVDGCQEFQDRVIWL